MRHLKNTKKFKRTPEERKRLWRDLSRGLIRDGKIVTFTARAKWFRPRFERLITQVKKATEDVQLQFKILREYFDEATSRTMIEDVLPKLTSRSSGYTSQVKIHIDFSNHDKSMVVLLTDSNVKPVAKKALKPEESTKDIDVEAKPKTKRVAKITKKQVETSK